MDNLQELVHLKQCIHAKNVKRANEIIELVERCVHQNITTAKIAFAMQKLFSEDQGTLGFLKQILQSMSESCKIFEPCIVKVFKLHSDCIRDFKDHIIQDYAKKIIESCLKYMQSSYASAKIKVQTVSTIYSLTEVKKIEQEDVSSVIQELLDNFDPRRTSILYGKEMLLVLGLISKNYPAETMERHLNLRLVFLETIEIRLLERHYVNFRLLAGAVQALCDYLNNFLPDDHEKEEISNKIYNYIKMLSSFGKDGEKEAYRNAMRFFAIHYRLFHVQIFNEAKYWHNTLLQWVQANIYEDKKIGLYATHSFHLSLAITLEENDSPNNKNILHFFIQNFKSTLEDANSTFYNIRIAVRGFGILSKACRALLDVNFVNDLLTLVLQRIKYCDYKDDSEKSKKLLEHLPDYIQSLSEIMANMDNLTATQLSYLDTIVVQLMRDFYYLNSTHHELVIVSLLKTFGNLQKLQGSIVDEFSNKVIFQGVAWACDRVLPYDLDWEDKDWKDNVTYRNYLPLWHGLVSDKIHLEFDRPKLTKKILHTMLNTLFEVIGKLNFSTKKRLYQGEDGEDQEFYFCDPNIDLVPVKPQDFHIFFNLVELYVEVLEQLSLTLKMEVNLWIERACEELVQKIIQYPLISGFVKLLEIIIKIGMQTQYFKQIDVEENTNQEKLLLLLKSFLKNSIQKVTQYTSELQLSYLRLIFNYPTFLIRAYMHEVAEVFVIAFDYGKNLTVLWIASMALRSLEELVEEAQEDELKSLLKTVMPSIETYLSSKTEAIKLDTKIEVVKSRKGKKSRINRKYNFDGEDTDLIKFQKRIIMLLGKLSLEECQYMLNRDEESLNLVKWEPRNHIELKIQNQSFHLDPLLPRIVYLALNSSDRKTKVAACELLHTVVIFLIGTNKLSTVMWKELCFKIIQLGCDSDAAVHDMFEPLLYQIVHYLSQPDFIHLEGTQHFVEALLELISHPNNNSIQDLSAKLLRELVSWSLRHNRREQQTTAPTNLQKLFDSLKFYSTDPDINKRKAAVLAFNNLYHITKDEELLISNLWMDLFYNFCINYVMCEEYYIENHIPPQLEQNNVVLENLLKMFVKKKHLLETQNPFRTVPEQFQDGQLKHIALWVLTQCGSIQRNYRMKCMEVFINLARALSCDNTSGSFVKNESITATTFIQIFEEQSSHGIGSNVNIEKLLQLYSPRNALKIWLENVLLVLDGYIWITNRNLIFSIKDVLKNSKSHLLKVIDHFFQSILFATLNEIFGVYNVSAFEESMGSYEFLLDVDETLESIKFLKRKILIRIVELLRIVFTQDSVSLPSEFMEKHQENLLQLINFMIFEPYKLDLPVYDAAEIEIARKVGMKFVLTLKENNGSVFNETFIQHFAHVQKEAMDSLVNTLTHDIKSTEVNTHQLLKAKGLYYSLLKLGVLDHSMNDFIDYQKDIFRKIFNSVSSEVSLNNSCLKKITVDHSLNIKEYTSRLLKISFLNKNLNRDILSSIFNDTELNTGIDGCTIKYGEHFLLTYKNVLMEFICRNIDDIMNSVHDLLNAETFTQIIKFICDLAEFLKKISDQDTIQMKKLLVDAVMRNLQIILNLANGINDSALYVIDLISYLMMIYQGPLNKIDESRLIHDWFVKLISNETTMLDVKTKAIFLLPCITGPESTCETELELSETLEIHLQHKHFPFSSDEFKPGSIKRDSYVACFQAILAALVASKSPVVFMFVIKTTATDPRHVLETEIRQAIDKFCAHQEDEVLIKVLDLVFQTFCEQKYTPEIRTAILKRFLLTVLKGSPENVIKAFVTKNVKTIKLLTERNLWTIHGLIDKLAGFKIIELIFGLLPKEYLNSEVSPFYEGGTASQGAKGAALVPVIKACTKAQCDSGSHLKDPIIFEYFRKYQCAVYNCLVAIISNTQTQALLYEKLLFKRDIIFWQNLISPQHGIYQMDSQEIDDYPIIKKRIVTVRNLNKLIGLKENRHFHTTSIYNSSLSQDVLKLDLSNTIVRSNADVASREIAAAQLGKITLEKMILNDHEIMPNICALINHMHDNKVMSYHHIPTWVDNFCYLLEEHPVINVRQFLAKVIDNCRDVFKNVVARVFRAILKLLCDEAAGTTMNAFITDLCVLLLQWSETYKVQTRDEQILAEKLIVFLMKNAYNARADIFKANLEILKIFIELWKDFLTLPTQYLYETITRSNDSTSKNNLYGIHLSAIVLSSGLTPWTIENKQLFFNAVYNSMYNKNPEVYRPAAQLLGMCLKKNLEQLPECNFFEDELIKTIITRLKKDFIKEENNCLDILYGIQKYCVQILEPFMNIITDNITNAIQKMKLKYLEMFLTGTQFCGAAVFKEMISSVNIRQLLKNSDYQLMALHIVNKALPSIKPLEGLYLYNDVIALINHVSPEIRDVVYEILMYIYKNYQNLTEIDMIHIRRTGGLLLEGILDEDSEIHASLMQFWNNEEHLPVAIDKRMLKLLTDIYHSEKDTNFLITCTQLLLQPAILDPFSNTSLFPYAPIGDVKYWERKIDTNWRRNSQYTRPPLFAETRALRATLATLSSQEGIRATEDYDETKFSPTIDPNTLYTASDTFRSQIKTQNSLYIETQQIQLNRRSLIQTVPSQSTQQDKDFEKLRKRFLKNPDTVQREKALTAINRRVFNEKKQYYAKRERELNVKLYRRYRDGDFPDLKVNVLAILLPLQALLKYDTIIAQQVFVRLFEASINILGAKNNSELYLMQIGRQLNQIMTETKSIDSGLIAAFLNIGLKYSRKMEIPPHIISTVSRATNNLSLGILYLEERLIAMDVEEPTSKKTSFASNDSVTTEQHWIQLAELYRCLSEHDVLNGIFADKIDSDSRFPEAFNAMSENRYDIGSKIWLNILREYQDFEKIEQDFSFESYYDCLAALGDWDALLDSTRGQLNKMDDVWEQDFNQEVILPHLLRGETRLVLEDRHKNILFLEDLERWSKVPQFWDHLRQNFSEELSMLMIAQGDFNQSRLIGETYIKSFLSEWSNLDVLCEKLRRGKLEDVRVISELYSTVGDFFLESHDKDKVLQKTINFYERAIPSTSDSTLFWEKLITYRSYLTSSALENMADDSLEQSKKLLSEAIHDQKKNLFNIGLEQGNIGFAGNILNKIRTDGDILQCKVLHNKLRIKQAEILYTNTNEKLNKLAEACASLENILRNPRQTSIKSNCLQLMSQIGSTLLDIPLSLQHIDHKIYHQYSGNHRPTPGNLFEKSCTYLKQSISILEINEEKDDICDCYIKIAELLIKQLESATEFNAKELQKDIVTYILLALKEGNEKARELFPRLLQLPDLQDTEVGNEFAVKAMNVPEWLYLPWIPQILCHINLHTESCLDILVEKLVKSYPGAMIYPLRLTLKSNKITRIRPFLLNLLNQLETPLMVKFMNSLSLICLPGIKVKTMIDKLLKVLGQPEITSTAFHAAVLEEKDLLFNAKDMQGSAYHYHKNYHAVFDEIIKLDVKTSMRKIQEQLLKIKADEDKSTRVPSISIEKLCPWLANYQWCNTNDSIEIPGQYNTMQKPRSDRHVKLIKVDSQLSVFVSIRRPIKIKFYGTDGKEHSFVIKYGEDLRQDERVQQLLNIASRKLKLDKNCREQNLKIVTYNVTPITEYYGLLSWVSNTMPLNLVLEKTMERHEEKDLEKDVLLNTRNTFIQLLCQAADLPFMTYSTDHKKCHAFAAKNISREKARINFRKVVSNIPSNLLKWSLLESASSMQNYFVLRYNFARSLAVINVTHWILGIGDRHTSNVLIDMKTFTLVGIDFGHAFGTATRDLGIPELIPFRLTPQLVNVLQPLGVSGILSRCMSHTLRCLRAERKTLKACMDVFVREPTLDWLTGVQNWGDGNRSWDPESRVNTAFRKLTGANPLKIVEEELLMNRITSLGYHTGYIKLLKSNHLYGNETDLSVDEQVKRLIAHAQDEALLSVTWTHWNPFV